MFNITNNTQGAFSLNDLANGQNPTAFTSNNMPQQPVQQAYQPVQQTVYQQPISQPTSTGGVILAKGQKLSLAKINAYLNKIRVGLGWDVMSQAYDLDAEAFMLGVDGKVLGDDWFIFYNQPVSPDASVRGRRWR